jgi:PPOX class probable F420-dependent enzyme
MPELTALRQIVAVADFFAVLATARGDGSVHASVVKAGVLDDPSTGGLSIGVVVGGGAKKLEHMRRSGTATVVFAHGGRWAAVEGPVRIVAPEDATAEPVAELLRAIFRAAGGTHDDWEEFDRVMAEDRRCAVFVLAQRVVGNA